MGGTLELLKSAQKMKAFRLSIPKVKDCSKPVAFIIDDERAWRNILSRWLKEQGFEVQVADTLQSAQKLLGEPQEKPQLVSLDISLDPLDSSNVDGLSLIDKVHELGGDIKVIVVTGYKDHATLYQKDVDLIIEKVKDGQALTKKIFFIQLEQLKLTSRVDK
ncbi:MAG: response regulator [Candidatus Electrothrix sp. AR1]|nr:response regulator [Candidatus Electrothrix sp. AR1]